VTIVYICIILLFDKRTIVIHAFQAVLEDISKGKVAGSEAVRKTFTNIPGRVYIEGLGMPTLLYVPLLYILYLFNN